VYSDKKIAVKAMTLMDTHRVHKEVISNLAVQTGERVPITEDNAFRKYIVESRKLGMSVITYVNKSASFFNLVERVRVEGKHRINKQLEDNDKLVYQMPANSKKYVLFRYHPTQDFKFQLLESTFKVKNA
jgi:hypothetical protein